MGPLWSQLSVTDSWPDSASRLVGASGGVEVAVGVADALSDAALSKSRFTART